MTNSEFVLPKPIMTYEQWASNKPVCVDRGFLPELSNEQACQYAIYVVKRDNSGLPQLGIEFSRDGSSVSSEYVYGHVQCTLDPCSNWGQTGEAEIIQCKSCRYWEVDLNSTAQILALVEEIKGASARMKNADLQAYLASCVS